VRGFFAQVANGNPLAEDWLCRYYDFAHAVDDVIDLERWDPESVLAVLVQASEVYAHPFYVLHGLRLQLPIITSTDTYLDSVHWEKAPELWKRQWAEVMRHAGNEVIMAVGMICGGWETVRKLSAPWMASCFIYHADRYGVPK